MKRLLTTAAISLALIVGAHAEPLVGKKLAAGPDGQPFCFEMSDLKEFMVAALTNDTVWTKTMIKEEKCATLKKGTAFAVLEDVNNQDEELHVIKVRAIGRPKGSVVGYTMNVGLVERK
jgi:hypothetical protein